VNGTELEYLKIKTESGVMYGGDQKLFGRLSAHSGCGMIAACDTLLYLDGVTEIPFKEYARFVTNFRDNAAYRRSLNLLGIPARRLVNLLNETAEEFEFKFYSRKKFRKGESLAEFIDQSIDNGMPVIVRVGANGKTLPYETPRGQGMMSWHYITATGISDSGMLTFSSWGKKGVMSCAELQRHFGFTGGVIGCRRKR